MDIQMPVLDGFAATQIVREQLQLASLPIIAMTANAMASDRDDCLAAGMNAHVGKPFDLKALVQTLLDITGYQTPPTSAELRSSQPESPAAAATPASSVLDVAAALGRMGGLSKLYLRSARDFLHGLPEQVSALRSVAGGDAAQCGLLAHSLKGTAALLGATDLSAIASHLEKQCKTGTAGTMRLATLERLKVLAQATDTQLREAIDRMDPPEQAMQVPAGVSTNRVDHQALAQALGQLLPQLQEDDLSVLETFAALRETLGTLPAALFDPLEAALQDLDLALALSACRHIQTWLGESADRLPQMLDT
jgi:CheY-like chemotaxis protein